MRNRRQIIIALELFNKNYDVCNKLSKWKFEAKKIFNENDECLIGSLPPLLSLSNDPDGNDEIEPFLDIIDEENGNGLIPYIPSLFDDWAGFEDLSLISTPPMDLDLINGETYAWSNLAERAKSYGYEFKGEPYKLFQTANVEEVQAVNDEEAEFPVLDPEDMDVLEKYQDQEVIEIEVLGADENINVNKEQIPQEKTRYMLPHQYTAGVDNYVLVYEDPLPSSTAENSVFDADADIFLDADSSYLSGLVEIVANARIVANDELEEYDITNSEELITSNSQELTASNSVELTASTSKELNVSNAGIAEADAEIAEAELEQG